MLLLFVFVFQGCAFNRGKLIDAPSFALLSLPWPSVSIMARYFSACFLAKTISTVMAGQNYVCGWLDHIVSTHSTRQQHLSKLYVIFGEQCDILLWIKS